jgi:hypothetical protein
VNVQGSKADIERGTTADYTVTVSTENTSASDVSVALTAQPTSLKPVFTSGCGKGDGTAEFTISSVSVKQPAELHAQVAVGSGAASVSSVKLTATASIVTTQKWTPPAAVETTAVTSAPASSATARAENLVALPLGPIPDLNAEASSLIGPGSAADLFPVISPSAAPSLAAPVQPRVGGRTEAPARNASADSVGIPRLTAEVTSLAVLALFILLALRHLSRSKRPGSKGSTG